MDYESALISSILINSDMTEVIETNLSAEVFVSRVKEWEYVVQFQRTHGAPPPMEQFSKIFPDFEISVPKKTPVSFFIEELRKRRVHNLVSDGMKEMASKLKAKDPIAALDEMRRVVIQAEDESRSSRDVNFTENPLGRIDKYKKRAEMGGITGYSTPWPCLDEATMGFHPEELIMVVGRGGVGKCVEENSLITDPILGVERTIREVVEGDQSKVVTWDEDKGIVSSFIDSKVDTGRKECLAFVTKSGREIIVTPEHPYLTPQGWIRADALNEGDVVGLPEIIPEPVCPKNRDLDEVRLLALLLSEGSYSGNHVGFSTVDNRMIEIAREYSSRRGAEVVYRGGCDYDITVGNVGGHIPNPARFLLREIGIDGKIAKDKTIPDYVYQLPNEQLAEFLGVFWMGDGYVDRGNPGITLSSRRMVYQIQHLLLRFQINSSVCYKPVKGGFNSWRLRVYSYCVEDFYLHIPLWGDKKDRIISAVASGAVANRSRAGAFKQSKVRGVFWDRIRSITQVGEKKIYDLTVRDTHCFVANDFIVHNTWAEVVLSRYHWTQGLVSLLFTKEMAVDQIIQRLDASNAEVSHQRFRSGQLTQDEYDRWVASLHAMDGSRPFWVVGDDDGAAGVMGVESKIEKYRPHIAYIDGFAYMSDDANSPSGWERMHSLCRGLKRVCQRKRIPIVVSHWFNLKGVGEAGGESDLKFGDIQNHFDLILGMYQSEDMRLNKEMKFKILKQREGVKLEWVTDWDLDSMRFEVKSLGEDDIPDKLSDDEEEVRF